MKNILITGASGFLGASLVKYFDGVGGFNVHAFARSAKNAWRLENISNNVKLYNVNLCDEKSVNMAVDCIGPDYIYHFAAFGAYPYQEDPNKIIETNILGTWNFLKATAKYDYKLFVSAGSSSEYGFKQGPMRESDVLEPNSYYSVSKCSQTLLTQYFARTENKPISIFRLFSVYGPLEEPTRLIPTVIRKCLNNEQINLVSSSVGRDFIYIDDVIEACLQFNNLSEMRGEILNIGTGIQSTIKNIADIVLDITQASSVCNYNASPQRIWDTDIWVGDCSLVKQKIGWSYKTSLQEGLMKTIEWVKNGHNQHTK